MGCVWNVDKADFFPLPLTQVDVVTGKDIVGGLISMGPRTKIDLVVRKRCVGT